MTKARDIASAIPAPSTVDATELGYLNGVTSAIQTQIDSKIGSASAINPTIVDAKGDIIAATAADTVARLAVGANGTVLTAASGQATGLEWATPSSGSMTLLSTTSLTGATTTISSIDQTYSNLYAIISSVTNATGNGAFRVAPNNQTNVTSQSMIIGGVVYNRADNYLLLSDPFNEVLGSGNNENIFTFTINDYTSASKYKTVEVLFGYNDTGNNHRGGVTSGYIRTTSAITSLVFSNSAGNLSTGTVLLYGVK